MVVPWAGVKFSTSGDELGQNVLGSGLVGQYQKEAGQIGADSPGPWMAWFKDNLAYVKLFGAVKDFSAYPDDGCSIELFTSKLELGYLEMEIMGPVVSLQPGAETSMLEEWAVYALDIHVKDRATVEQAVEELRSCLYSTTNAPIAGRGSASCSE